MIIQATILTRSDVQKGINTQIIKRLDVLIGSVASK